MQREEVHAFVDILLGVNAERKDVGNWVSIPCPFARWTHERGTDNKPSAGISVTEPGEHSIFNCFTCGQETRGPLARMLSLLEDYSGDSYSDLKDSIYDDEEFSGFLPDWGSRRRRTIVDRTEVNDDYLELYSPAYGHWYLEQRGITDDTVGRLGLLVDDADSRGDERILFPVRHRDGVLAGITGRATDDTVEPKVRDYHGLKKEQVLLGLHTIANVSEYIVIVEGLFDYAVMQQYGYAAVATMFAGMTDTQSRLLIDLGIPIVLFYDNDMAGRRAAKEAAPVLAKQLPVSVVTYGKTGLGSDVKDPGEATEEEVRTLINKAVLWTRRR